VTLERAAGEDSRLYLVVMILLESGMKSSELLRLTPADVDTSDRYRPELWIRHRGKASTKDRKVGLPARFTDVYEAYRSNYQVTDGLFPFSDKYLSKLFAQLRQRSGIQKELTAKTLRHTHTSSGRTSAVSIRTASLTASDWPQIAARKPASCTAD
jgi:integrase